MKFGNKLGLFLLFFVSMTFFSHFAWAQNVDNLRNEIFPKLRDRRCTTLTIDKCRCPDAKEMRAYVDALIEMGAGKDDIFYKVAKKFSLNSIVESERRATLEKRLISEVGQKRPQIALELVSFDFGKVNKSQGQIKKNIKLFNNGSLDLVIKDLKVSCTCVTVALTVGKNKSPYFSSSAKEAGWQMVIEPGKSGELEIVFDLAHPSIKVGKVTREIFIVSNDPLYPEVLVRATADVSG